MATKRRNVRYPLWMECAVEKFAEKNKISDISKALIFLLECELNRRGYFRTDYEPNIEDWPLTNDIQGTDVSDILKKKDLEICRLERQLEILKSGKTLEQLQEESRPSARFRNKKAVGDS
jgi:hypothetical protein